MLFSGVHDSPEKCQFETEKCQFETEKCQFETEKCQFETEKCQFETENCQFETENCQFETHGFDRARRFDAAFGAARRSLRYLTFCCVQRPGFEAQGGRRGRADTLLPQAFPSEIRRLPLDCHCNSGVNSQFWGNALAPNSAANRAAQPPASACCRCGCSAQTNRSSQPPPDCNGLQAAYLPGAET